MTIPATDEIRTLREQIGLSQAELGSWLGYSRRTVQRWEAGETAPKPASLLLLRQSVAPYATEAADRTGGLENGRRSPFRFIDLFAGIGGMRVGFEAAGGRCVYTCEIDRFCRQTYAANFAVEHVIATDIQKVDPADVPGHDLLVAGFPCQPFSVAGVSKKNSLGRPHGFADRTQGTLFFDLARILAYHRPASFLLENVKNLRSHDRGRTFRIILQTLEEIGYTLTTRVIDAQGLVPQHRERVFIAGFLRDTGFRLDDVAIPSRTDGPILRTVLHPEDGSEETEAPYTEGPLGSVSGRYTLSDKLWAYLQDYAERHRRRGNGFGFGLADRDGRARTLSARYYKDGSEILVPQEGRSPRRLTPRECSRLMGFDRPGESEFDIPVSDTQAYKQFGNAVVVPVVEAIATAMAPHITAQTDASGQLSLFPFEGAP